MEAHTKLAHRAVDVVCGLFFAVDRDLSHLPEKRTNAAAHINSSTVKIPDTVHPGYGELTYPALAKLFDYLCDEAPVAQRLTAFSSFLDVGSGFGKAVLHAAIRGGVQRSVGVEYVPVRRERAQLTLQHLQSGRVPGLVDQCGSLPALSPALESVRLVEGNVADQQHHRLIHAATHVYCFDVLFGERLMRIILEQVQKSHCCIMFLSYHAPPQLVALGLVGWSCVHRVPGRTTGKQRFTCHVYTRTQSPVSFLCPTPALDPLSITSASCESPPLAPTDSDGMVVPDDDHLTTRCILCGKKRSPAGRGGKKRVFVTEQWKQRMNERASIPWTKPMQVVIHDGCRCRLRRLLQTKSTNAMEMS